jgi:Rrf2 family nitric oxide-sensitive transcriptional repressor
MAGISVGEVFRKLEENVPVAECLADVDNTCPLKSACRLREALSDAVEAFYARLDGVTLDALVCDNDALFDIFSAPPCLKRFSAPPCLKRA